MLETNLDDVSSEILGAFVESALAAGALDVFHTPIQMRRIVRACCSRCFAPEADADKFSELLLRETTVWRAPNHCRHGN